jgi:uncharacterized membrane protein
MCMLYCLYMFCVPLVVCLIYIYYKIVMRWADYLPTSYLLSTNSSVRLTHYVVVLYGSCSVIVTVIALIVLLRRTQ